MKKRIKNIYSFTCYYFPFFSAILENIYFFINNITTSKLKYRNNIEFGKKLLKTLTNDKNYYYVLINQGIGDSVIVASYAYYLEKKYNKKLAFIVPNSHAGVIEKFRYIKRIVPCDKKSLEKIVLYISSTKNYETNKYKYAFFNMKISKNGIRNWSSAYWDKKLLLSDRYKKFVFNQEENYKMKKSSILNDTGKKEKILKKYSLTEKSIIIMPYAYSVNQISNEMWERLVSILTKKGYKIFTNIGNNDLEKPIINTKALNISLSDLYDISNDIEYFISLRSGVCEFLALSSTKMIVLNDNEKNYEKWDDVNIFSKNKTVKNIYMNNKNCDTIIMEILKNMEDN